MTTEQIARKLATYLAQNGFTGAKVLILNKGAAVQIKEQTNRLADFDQKVRAFLATINCTITSTAAKKNIFEHEVVEGDKPFGLDTEYLPSIEMLEATLMG